MQRRVGCSRTHSDGQHTLTATHIFQLHQTDVDRDQHFEDVRQTHVQALRSHRELTRLHGRGDWLVLALAGLREDFEARGNQLPEVFDEVQEERILKQKRGIGGGDELSVMEEEERKPF